MPTDDNKFNGNFYSTAAHDVIETETVNEGQSEQNDKIAWHRVVGPSLGFSLGAVNLRDFPSRHFFSFIFVILLIFHELAKECISDHEFHKL